MSNRSSGGLVPSIISRTSIISSLRLNPEIKPIKIHDIKYTVTNSLLLSLPPELLVCSVGLVCERSVDLTKPHTLNYNEYN